LSRYDDVLSDYRNKGFLLANETITELYTILTEEEKLEPQDARSKIEFDCVDLWSKATIRKYLPPEAKDKKKRKAGKVSAERRMEIAQTTDGNCVGINPTRLDEKEQESETFITELSTGLAARGLSPELIEANKLLAEKDRDLEELKSMVNQSPAAS
jgi:hypothetical protein